jgi:AraC-like DNA-binding protein
MYEKAKEYEYNTGVGLALFMISNAYGFMTRNEEEEKYMRESIEVLKKEDLTMLPFIASGYFYLCQSLMSQERYNDALLEAKEFEKINLQYEEHSRSKQPTTWVNLYRILFLAYIGVEDFDNAEKNYQKLERLSGGVKENITIAQGWAKIYEGRKQYEKAIEMLDKQIALYDDINSLERNVNIPVKKAQVLAKMGRAMDVYDIYSQIFDANNIIRNTEFNVQLDELRTQYEVDKITAENELNLAQKIRNRNFFLFALGGCVLLALVLGIWIYHSRTIVRKNRGLYLQIKEQDRLAEELEHEREESRKLRRIIQPEATGVTEEDDDIFFERLTVLMKEKQLYTNNEIKRQDIAGQIGLSDRRLHDCVKNNTGMSFTDYINSLRLNHSRELLSRLDENLTIEAIALDSGFNSRVTFYRLFNEKYGLSPKQFKEFVK